MQNYKQIFYKTIFFLFISAALNAQVSSSINSSNRIEPLNTIPKASTASISLPPIKSVPTPTAVPQSATYLHPGILVFRNNTWEGGDHLLNISNNIGVYVSIVKPESESLPVSEQELKNIVEQIFKKFNINPVTLAPVGQPPLPAFQIQVLAYPIDRGYVVACEGRLFESVTLQRFILDSMMAFQAITWEKKGLQVGPTNQIGEQIQSNVAEIAQAFGERFEAFERRKKDLTR
jgi:hypothetical protein